MKSNKKSLGLGGFALVLATVLALVLRPALGADNCTQDAQLAALWSLYDASGGPDWKFADNWNSTAPCVKYVNERTKGGDAGRVSLPYYCCWSGIECCLSNAYSPTAIPCTRYQCNCTVSTVTSIALGRNNLSGSLANIFSPTFIQGLACSLRIVFFGGNDLYGTLPPEMSKFPEMRILSLSSNVLTGTIPEVLSQLVLLEELDLSNNRLAGTVPPTLCGGAERFSVMRDLILSNNALSGTISIPECESLIYLDAQNNNFSGPLPDLSSYRQLHILRLGNNSFSGAVQLHSFDLRLLVVLDLSNNYLTGALPNFVGNSSQLTLVRLYGNYFNSSLPDDLFSVGTLATVVAYDNLLTGTLPENIGHARGLSSLQLSINRLHGTLPLSLELMAISGASVDVSLNSMSCCGQDFVLGQGYNSFDLSKPRLPPFLALSPDLSRPAFDNIDGGNANMRCPFIQLAGGITLQNNSRDGVVPTSVSLQAGPQLVSPAASNGTKPTQPVANSTILTWGLDPEYFLYEGCYCLEGFREVWLSPGLPSMGPRLTCERISKTWYETYPWAVVLIVLGGLLVLVWLTYLMCFRRGKNAAIVQGCFNIRKRIQGEPIGGQVSIVVTDIEGYSDLMKQSPALMTRALNLHNAIIRKSRWSNFGYTLEQEGDSYALVFYEAHDAVIFCLQTQLALNRQAWPEGLFAVESRDMASKRRTQAPSILGAISLMTNNLTHSLFGGRISMAGQQGSDERSMSAVMPSAMRVANASTDGNTPDSRQSSTIQPAPREFSTLLTPSALGGHNKGHPVLFNGIKVRMGIATGTLPPGSTSKGSAVMDLAKMVSDAANGGQVMIEEKTFKSIKERMEEFGAVDHNGMNFKKLNSIKPPWYSCLRRKHLRNPDDALLLDMGEYTNCPGCKRLPLFQLEATPAGETPGGGGGPPATPKGSGRRGGKGAAAEPLRLFQIVPPALAMRAKTFGNKVTMKDEWYCSDEPYFAAPGTLDAPLGLIDGPLLLPAITMAFAIVDNGKAFSSRNRRDTHRVHDVCAACIRACLRCVPGGYLCRMQDGDLKYMVAFETPQAAVEWSLLLQDVLLYADWPETALKFWREEYDDRGRMLFRGPRMKIGLCEGSPRSIIPDHIGRADYHGASINQAARYMDAAAHGGMIALEATLATKVMDGWREDAAKAAADAAAAADPSAARRAAAEAAAEAAAGIGAGPTRVSSSLSQMSPVGGVEGATRSAPAAVPLGQGLHSGSVRQSRMSAVQEAEGHEETSRELPQPLQGGPLQGGPRGSGRGVAPWADEEGLMGDEQLLAAAAGGGGAGSLSRPDPRSGQSEPLLRSVTAGGDEGAGGPDLWPKARKPIKQSLKISAVEGVGSDDEEETPKAKAVSGPGWAERAALVGAEPPQPQQQPQQPEAGGDQGHRSLLHDSSLRSSVSLRVGELASPRELPEVGSPRPEPGPGPVAEGVDRDGMGASGGADAAALNTQPPAAAADHPRVASSAAGERVGGAEGSNLTTAALKDLDGSVNGAGVAAGGGSPAQQLLDRANVDSGPSLTSLASSGTAQGGGGSSASMSPAPLQPQGSSGDRTGSPAIEGGGAAGATSHAALDAGGGGGGPNWFRPPRLDTVISPAQSYDGSASGGNAFALAVAAPANSNDGGAGAGARPSAGGLPAMSLHGLTSDDTQNPGSIPSRPIPASRSSAPGVVDLNPGIISTSLPPRPRPCAAAPAASGLRYTSAFGMRTHVSFAAEPAAAAAAAALHSHPIPAAASPAAPPPAFPRGFFSTAAPLGGAAGAASVFCPPLRTSGSAPVLPPGSSVTSSAAPMRSPRPPSLALPSEKERDEALRAERAAVEASRKVQVDGPADARYQVRVCAFRIGLFRFKGNPEPVEMAYITLDHLVGRKFPLDAPKGKGAKVGDASGLLDACDTSLADLAALLRDRYMLNNAARHPLRQHLDVARSSPSNRRLRLLLGGSSMGSGAGQSPGSPAASMLGKSRSMAARNGGSSSAGGGGGGVSSLDSDLPHTHTHGPGGAALQPSGTIRRGSNLVGHLVQLASASMRWAAGREGGEAAGEAAQGQSTGSGGVVSVGLAAGGGSGTPLGGAVSATESLGGAAGAAGATGGAAGATGGAAGATGGAAGATGGGEVTGAEAGGCEAVRGASEPPRVPRPAVGASPLRHMTARGDPPPAERPADTAAAAAGAGPAGAGAVAAGPSSGGGAEGPGGQGKESGAGVAAGDECV